MSSPSELLKVNYLVMKHLHFESVRGDLQEGHGCAFRCQSQSPRAQNRGFCALLASGTPVFGHFEHKIEVFVRFYPPKPPFSGISSTKSAFLCSRGGESGIRKRNRGDAYPSCKSPRTLQKRKYLITKLLTFSNALGELKSRPPRGPMCPRSA